MFVARKIAYNVVFNATAKILSTGLALVNIGFITRYLGKEGFGNYATVLAFFAFFGAAADLGIYSIATREISREKADEKTIISNAFSLRLTSSLIVLLLSPLVLFLPYSQELRLGILIAAASFIFSSSYVVLNGVFQKNLAMDKVASTELAGKLIQTGFIILAVKKDWGFTVINISLLLYMIFNFVLIFFLSRHYVKFRLSFDWPYWRKFLKESLPLGISVVITFIYFKLDTILLSLLRNATDVGIYSAAYKIIENITFFPAMIVGLIFPILSRFIHSNRPRFQEISDKTFKIFVILTVPLTVGIIFLAPEIIRLIGGAGFSESAGVLKILVFALVFIFFGNFFNNILVAGNAQKSLVKILSVCAAFNIAANLIVIPLFSYNGAAVTSLLTEFLAATLTAIFVARKLNYIPRLENWRGILLSGAAMAAFLFGAKMTVLKSFPAERIDSVSALQVGLSFLISTVSSSAVYFLFLWLTKAVRSEEILSIVSRQKPSEETAFNPSGETF